MNRSNIIRIWKSKGQILEGIKNKIFKKEDVEAIARQRNTICHMCIHIDHEGKKCAMPGTQPCCAECGCSLAFKTRSLSSSCPKGFWVEELTEDEDIALNDSIN